jgi:hypothetical protein
MPAIVMLFHRYLLAVLPFDRVPIRLLREGDLDKIGPKLLGAARAFVAGG